LGLGLGLVSFCEEYEATLSTGWKERRPSIRVRVTMMVRIRVRVRVRIATFRNEIHHIADYLIGSGCLGGSNRQISQLRPHITKDSVRVIHKDLLPFPLFTSPFTRSMPYDRWVHDGENRSVCPDRIGGRTTLGISTPSKCVADTIRSV